MRRHALRQAGEAVGADRQRRGALWLVQAGGAGGGGRQRGALRINCIDCLDRTNVVQGWLARKQLERLLAQLGLVAPGMPLPEAFPEVERQFRLVWADHGDDISRQYAGTGALKSGFTRTGRRSVGGLLDDGAKSAARYLRNNFADGRRQDALDLLTGAYVPSKEKPSPFKPQPSPALPFAAAMVALLWAAVTAWRMATGRHEASVAGAAQLVLLPLALAGAILAALVRNGSRLVNCPQLCPDLTQPW
ncbi:hypothetical protein WJX81_001555 [Elliptochloris bilobata]|uniref:SAC domain-containing protein n=1 Tax=Elliptochloris bilobata TaxID=381761 RepID=A0AAW1QKF3_9CHLO